MKKYIIYIKKFTLPEITNKSYYIGVLPSKILTVSSYKNKNKPELN
jgi:hypothetical protein